MGFLYFCVFVSLALKKLLLSLQYSYERFWRFHLKIQWRIFPQLSAVSICLNTSGSYRDQQFPYSNQRMIFNSRTHSYITYCPAQWSGNTSSGYSTSVSMALSPCTKTRSHLQKVLWGKIWQTAAELSALITYRKNRAVRACLPFYQVIQDK